MTTLKITIGDREQLDDRTRRRIKAAAEGEEFEDAEPVLNFGSYHDLTRLLSDKNLELLEAIGTHDPKSISEVADIVGRDYKQVHRNLSELADIGMVEFDREGSGHARKTRLAYDQLEIDISFTDSGGQTHTVTAD